jgi:hypothetical protein
MTSDARPLFMLPDPVVDVPWGCGPGSVQLVVRPGTGFWPGLARAGEYETTVFWTSAMKTEDGEGTLTRMRTLAGGAASVLAAAMRGLAHLSAIGRWSADLRDFVLQEAGA